MQISVIVHPNARKPRIEKDPSGNLHIYVNDPPLEGRANKAIIKALSKHLQVKKNQITLLSGEKSKNKLFEIT